MSPDPVHWRRGWVRWMYLPLHLKPLRYFLGSSPYLPLFLLFSSFFFADPLVMCAYPVPLPRTLCRPVL